ncbi:hypothetical protein [Streptomyces sp. NPDC002187]|uniref:hypothetical protein n=1 Tax=Streptomyces sp. NPDC002187 TaxID=3364637 RepID=UPI0036B8BB41
MIRRRRILQGVEPAHIPVVGEQVLARRSAVNPWTLAEVVRVRPAARGRIRVDFRWLADNPDCLTPVASGTRGNVFLDPDGWPPLIARLPEVPEAAQEN